MMRKRSSHYPAWMKGASRLIIIGFLLVGTLGCRTAPAPAETGQIIVTVSIVPQQYFVERIGGEHVQVNILVPPGADAHTYEPKPAQLRALTRSQVYFTLGVEFEKAWMGRILGANPSLRVVDTAQGIERLPMVAHHEETPRRTLRDRLLSLLGRGGEASSSGEAEMDPHIWLSPRLVRSQAQIIYETLAELDPAHREEYRAHFEQFLADIDALDREIAQSLSALESRTFMVFHPAWGYFAQDYGLTMLAVEVEGQEPSPQELAHIIALAKQEKIRVIFAQPEFSTRAAETIAREIGGQVLLISPLAYDWLGNLRAVAQAFAASANP